jgi:hypothetical protein
MLPVLFFFVPVILWTKRTFFAVRNIILGQISMVGQWHEVLPSLPTHQVVSS